MFGADLLGDSSWVAIAVAAGVELGVRVEFASAVELATAVGFAVRVEPAVVLAIAVGFAVRAGLAMGVAFAVGFAVRVGVVAAGRASRLGLPFGATVRAAAVHRSPTSGGSVTAS
jgi:hypothetical protein